MTAAVDTTKSTGGNDPKRPVPPGSTMVTLKIARLNPEDPDSASFKEYEVPALPSDRLLNLLVDVKYYIDGSLGCRLSCAHGVCGSAAMLVNGGSRLACKVLMKDMLPKDGKSITFTIGM